MSGRRLAALSAPIFVLIVVVLTVHEWSFLHQLGWRVWGSTDVPWPSSTALGSWGWLQVLNFLQLGLAVLYLSDRFTELLPARRARTVARWALRLAGLALLALCFKTDPSATVKTWHGGIHALAFVVVVLATLVAMFAVARASTQPVGRASMFAAVAVIVFTAVSIAWGGSGAVFGTFALLTILGWIELLALRVARERPPDTTAPTPAAG